MKPDTLLQAVREVARVAGDMALREYESGTTVERKADGSEVTAADRHAEQTARDWIARRFPNDAILGEELGDRNPGAARRWIIDPIDGTASFVRRVPLWGTLVAVAEGDVVMAGALYCPAVNEMVCAATGEGCWWNDRRAGVSTTDRLEDATVLTTTERFRESPERQSGWRALSNAAQVVRAWGDCYGYLLVVTGRADVMVDPIMSPWDSAALLPIVTEAGGVFTDWAGRVTGFGGSAVATNAALAQTARERLGVPIP